MDKHLPGPYRAFNPGRHFVRSERNFKSVCEVEGVDDDRATATTERIAACMNALAGLSTQDIESDEFQEYVLGFPTNTKGEKADG
jgi:hypothetical protein